MIFNREERIECYQWFKNGDHPKDDCDQLVGEKGEITAGEGRVVGYYPYEDDKNKICEHCDKPFSEHGKIGLDLLFNRRAGQGPEIVCPGMFIRTFNPTHISGGPYLYNILPGFNPTAYDNKCMDEPKVEEMEALGARLLWMVKLDKNYYPVYDIPGRHHYGRENGDVDTWWIKRGETLWPYSDRFTNRICFEYNFREYNSTKMKWDELRISKGVSCTITANDKPFYQFNTRDIEFAFAKAQYLVVHMMEHPYNFLEPEKENGRKIYWYGLPATVRPTSHPGEIAIIPDYTVGINKPEWWRIYFLRKEPVGGNPDEEEVQMFREDDAESMESDYINWGDALSDGHIGWFRKETKKGNIDPSANLQAQ